MKYQRDSTVRVQLYDGRIVVAKVCAIDDTVAGRKVRIHFGDCVHYVNADQVLAVISFAPKQPTKATVAQKKKLLLIFLNEMARVLENNVKK